MAKKKTSLPKFIFAYEETDGKETYLVADYARNDTSRDASKLIGTYQLVEIGEIVNAPVYQKR